MARLARSLLLGLVSFSVYSLHVAFSPVSGHGLSDSVVQTHERLQANVGSLVRIKCQVNISRNAESIRVKWVKDTQWNCCHVVNNSHFRSEMWCSERIHCAWEDNVFTLIIENAQIEDSGKYKCEIIIELPPPFVKKSGLWTILNVTAQSDPGLWFSKGGLPLWGWIALGVAMVVLFALILSVVCYLRVRRRRIAEDDSFYLNVIFSKKRQAAAENLNRPERCSHSHYTTNRRPGGPRQYRVSWRRTNKPTPAQRSPETPRSVIKPGASSSAPKHTDQQVDMQRPGGFKIRRYRRDVTAKTVQEAQTVPKSRPTSSQATSKKQTGPTSNPFVRQKITQKQIVPMSRPRSSQAPAQKPTRPKCEPTTRLIIAYKPSIPMSKPVSSQVDLEKQRMPTSSPTSSQVTEKAQTASASRSSSSDIYANSADQPQAQTVNTSAAKGVAGQVVAQASNSYVNAPTASPKMNANKQPANQKS